MMSCILMSIISPIDEDLAVIYEKFAPNSFIEWLENLGLDFITVSDDEYQCMSCNVLALAPREVVILESCVSLKTNYSSKIVLSILIRVKR